MYAVEATVRFLAKNRKSQLELAEIVALAAMVEPEIDSKLTARYHWPLRANGDAYGATPPLVVSIANYLTAALVEKSSTANATGADGEQHPFGQSLEKMGRKLLDRVISGAEDQAIPELEQRIPVRAYRATKRFNPSGGFSGRGRGSSRFGDE